MDVLLHRLSVGGYKTYTKAIYIYADAWTRTYVARFRTIRLSRFNGLGCACYM